MRKLRYTVRNVSNYERKNKKSFLELVQNAVLDANDLIELVALGIVEKEIKEENRGEAVDIIQGELDEGVTLFEITDNVIEEVTAAGFFTEVLSELKIVEQVKKMKEEAVEEMAENINIG